MAKDERTSADVGSIASKALKDPKLLTEDEIRTLAASALTQRPDRKTAAKPKATTKPAR